MRRRTEKHNRGSNLRFAERSNLFRYLFLFPSVMYLVNRLLLAARRAFAARGGEKEPRLYIRATVWAYMLYTQTRARVYVRVRRRQRKTATRIRRKRKKGREVEGERLTPRVIRRVRIVNFTYRSKDSRKVPPACRLCVYETCRG